MTRIFERAVEAARALSPEEQDDIGRLILQLAGAGEPDAVAITESDRAAIARSKAAAAAGELASDGEVRAVWAKKRA